MRELVPFSSSSVRGSLCYTPPTPPAGVLPTTWAGPFRPLHGLNNLILARNLLGRVPDGAGGYTYPPLPDGASDWGTGDRWLSPFPNLKWLNLDTNSYRGRQGRLG